MKTDRRSGFSLATLSIVVCATAFLLAVAARALADVTPANASVRFLRADPSEVVSNGPFFKGERLLLTNCVLYTGTTTAEVQNLTSCTITVKVGTASQALLTTNGVIQSAANGTWWALFTVPTNIDNAAILQVTVSDQNGTTYTYPWKVIPVRSAL